MATAKAGDDVAEELRAELKALREDFAQLFETVKTFGRDQAEAAVQSAKEAVEQATDRVKMSAEDARRKGQAAADEIEAIVARHPLTALLVALGLGYIVGRIRH